MCVHIYSLGRALFAQRIDVFLHTLRRTEHLCSYHIIIGKLRQGFGPLEASLQMLSAFIASRCWMKVTSVRHYEQLALYAYDAHAPNNCAIVSILLPAYRS
jgi:hypothetical protein